MFSRSTRFVACLAGLVVAIVISSGNIGGPIAAAAQSKKAAQPQSGGNVTLLASVEPPSFDPKYGSGYLSYDTTFAIYDELITINPFTQKIIPHLAESVTSNANLTVWTIKLRPNLTFTDGTPFNAAAIKANWDRLALPATGATGGVASILPTWTYTPVNATTLQVTLPAPSGAFPATIAGLGGGTQGNGLSDIASPTALAKYGATYGTSPATTVGAGAFTLTQWVHGDHILLTKNPHFYGAPRPYLDTITIKPVSDPTTRATAMLANQADIAYFTTPGPFTAQLTQAGLQKVGIQQQEFAEEASINVSSNQALGDVRVRQALSLANDPVSVTQEATNGLSTPVTTWFPKSSSFYNPAVKYKSNNVAAAQKLINQYVAQNGPIPTIVVTTSPALQSTATAMVQAWSRLKNITFSINPVTVTENSVVSGTGNYQIDMTVGPTPATYVQTYYDQYYTGVTGNVTKFSSAQLDALLAQGVKYADIPTRKKYVSKITALLLNQAPIIPDYYVDDPYYAQKNVMGLQLWSVAKVDLSYIWLKKS
jgi:peptide/nickel transport system substrate-binding protein